MYPPCQNDSCKNDGRYDSGYCALCDLKFNDGKGRRIFDLKQTDANACAGREEN